MIACPNTNDAKWKELVSLVGEDKAYEYWLQSGQDLDNINLGLVALDSGVAYKLKAVDILQSPKADEIFRKGDKNDWSIDKILTELAIPKEQKELIKSFGTRNREEILTSLLANYSYTVEINTAKKRSIELRQGNELVQDGFNDDGTPYYVNADEEYQTEPTPTQHYSNLTVPGGTNYTENEIATPAITPSIKGHAQFATDNGIGWFRSDDKTLSYKGEKYSYYSDESGKIFKRDTVNGGGGEISLEQFEKETGQSSAKTRRILEVQSDLFQKGRDKSDIVLSDIQNEAEYRDEDGAYDNVPAKNEHIVEILKAQNQNQFLQLLNKDNNWVTFFVKSIIQDSAKKGYEKVLFPSGNTASKVEGHTTLEEFKKQKEDRISKLKEEVKEYESKNYYVHEYRGDGGAYKQEYFKTLEEANKFLEDKSTKYGTPIYYSKPQDNTDVVKATSKSKVDEINQLKQELERIEKEGFGALKPIYNFYENTVTNILKKNFKVNKVTDEYGNTWNEVLLTNEEKKSITLSLEDKEPYIYESILIPGFTPTTQDEAVQAITEQVLISLKTKGVSVNTAFNDYINTLKQFVADPETDSIDKKNYNRVINNISKLRDLVITKLGGIGLLNKEKVKNDNQEIQAGEDEVSDGFYWEDDWVFKFDSKANALKKVKEFLLFVPDTYIDETTGNYLVHQSHLGTTKYLPFDEVFEDLKGILADTPFTWEAKRKRLEEYKTAKPWIHSLLKSIDSYTADQQELGGDGDIEQLLNQFVSTFNSVYGSSKTLLHGVNGSNARIIDTDQNSAQKNKQKQWEQNYNKSKILKVEGDNKVIDSVKRDEVISKINSLRESRSIADTVDVLTTLGIDVSAKTAKELIDGKVGGRKWNKQFDKYGLFDTIKNRLAGKDSGQLQGADATNPVLNNSSVRDLALIEIKNSRSVFTNSYINGENNIVHAFSLPKYITDVFNKIIGNTVDGIVVNQEYLDNLQQVTFQKTQKDTEGNPIYENWIYQLQNNEILKDYFNISPFDTRKERDEDGDKLSKMSDLDFEFTKFTMFQNDATTIKGLGRLSQYLFTIPSKTTSYIVQAPAVDVPVQIGKTISVSKSVEDALYAIVLSEIGRINSNIVTDINKYEEGRKNFYFFPALDKLPIFNEDKTVMLPSTVVGGKTVESIIRQELMVSLGLSIKQQITAWRDLGIIDGANDIKYLTNNYSAKFASETNKNHKIFKIAADYVVNNKLFMYNMHQMFIGDPALYFKTNVEETWKDLGKRLALQIAPGQAPTLENTEEEFISIKIQDREGEYSLNKAQLEQRLNEKYKDYEKINGTDAQEYETLEERLRVMKAFGKISTKMYNSILARYRKEKDDFVLAEDEKLILQPLKPVYTASNVDPTKDVMAIDYIKSSSIVLLPEFTKGIELDKLRKAMENVQRQTGLPVRAAYKSATKVGGVAFADVFEKDGTIKEGLDLSNNYNKLKRSGFRLQQDVPYDPEYDEVTKGTQPTKLLFNGLLGKIINGKSGEDIQKEFNRLHQTLFSESLLALNKEILDSTGKLDIVKLAQKLQQEAISRGWSPAEVASLALTPDGKFAVPFWMLTSGKYEALMTSLYTKRIIKQQLHGASYVLASEEGMQGFSEGIVYTDKYDGALKPYAIKEDGTIQPAQVLLPWRFKINDKVVSIKEFIKEDGKLDTERVPQELLTRFGFRIPTQGHNSMSLIEVVGFLPEAMGDLVIAPRDFVVQMGSDFDVDKLYVFDYYTNYEEGKFSKYTYDEGKEKAAFDNYKTYLTDKLNSIDKAYVQEKSYRTGDVVVDGLIDTIFADVLNNDYTEEEFTEFLATKGLTADEYKKLIKKVDTLTFEDYTRKNVIKDTKNKIVDIHKEVLNSPEVYNAVVSPLNTGKLKGLAEEMKKNLKVDIHSYLDPLYHNNKYLEGSDGKAMVGIESLVSVFSVALERNNAKQNLQLYIPPTPENKTGSFDYFIIKDEKGNNVSLSNLSSPNTYNGKRRKIEVIAAFQSAAVDNEKDPMLYYLNSNPQTSKAKMTMLLLGLEEDYITYFLNQPIIREYTKRVRARQSKLVRQSRRDIESQVLLEILEEQEKKNPKVSINTLVNIGYSTSDLKTLISKPTNEDSYAILTKYKQLMDYGKSLSQLQAAINIETKGTGKNLLEVVDRKEKYYKAQEVKNIYNVEQLFRTNYYTAIVENSIVPAYNTLVVENEYFKYNSEFIKKAYNKVIENGYKDELTIDDKMRIYNAAKSYAFSNFYTVDERRRIFYGDNSLARRIDNYTKKKDNAFLVRLQLNFGVSKRDPDTIRYNASKEDYVDNLSLYSSFSYLLESVNEEERSIGEDLITYFFINGGIQQASEWGKFIHPEYLKRYKNGAFLEYLNKFEFKEDARFFVQYFQHNPKQLVTLKNAKINGNKAEVPIDDAPDMFKQEIELQEVDQFGNILKNEYIFKRVGSSETTALYDRISRLGKPGFKEYQNSDNAISLVNKNYIPKEQNEVVLKPNPPVDDTKTITTNTTSYASDDLVTSLEMIKNEKWLPLVNLLKTNSIIKSGVPVIMSTEIPGAGKATLDENGKYKIELNAELSGDLEQTLLHEAIHIATMDLIRNPNKATEKQRGILNRIYSIVDSLNERIASGELDALGYSKADQQEFLALREKVINRTATPQEVQRLKELRPRYYGLYDYTEFVTEILTNEVFQNNLNQIPYDGKKTLLDRLLDLFAQLVNTFSTKEGSVSEEGIKNVLLLIDSNKETVKKKSIWDVENKTIPGEALSLEDFIKTDYPDLILAYKTRLNLLSENIGKAAGDKARQEELKEKRREIIENIKELESDAALDAVISIAQRDLEEVNKLLQDRNISYNDLYYVLNTIKTWQTTVETLLTKGDYDTVKEDLVEDIKKEANKLYRRWENITKDNILKLVKETTGVKNLTQDVLNAQERINALTANMLDISASGNLVLMSMDKWIREANDRANIEAIQVQKQIETITTELQKTNEFKRDGFYVFAQTTKDGKLTGKVVSEYSDDYYQTRRELKGAIRKTKGADRKKARKDYTKWFVGNHNIVNIAEMYIADKDGRLVSLDNQDYLDTLKKQVESIGGSFEAVVNEQKLLVEDYNNRLTAIIDAQGEVNSYVRKWVARKSPLIFFNSLSGGKAYRKIDGAVVYNEGEAFLYKTPARKWVDPKWKTIQANPALKSYYDYFTKTLNTLYHYIPYRYRENMNLTDIPNISRGLTETYHKEGLQGAFRQWQDERVESISVSAEEAEMQEKVNPITKRKEFKLNVKYLQNLSPEEKSYDLSKVLNMFAITTLNYKYKAQVEDQLRLSYEILQNSLEVVKDVSGDTVYDKYGRKYVTKDLKNFNDMLTYSMEAFYGQRRRLQGITKKKIYTNKAKTKYDAFVKAIEDKKFTKEVLAFLDKDLDLRSITSDIVTGNESATIKAKIKADAFLNQNTRYTTASKIGDVILNIVQLKGMGLNLFGGITNVAYGWFANYAYAAGGVDFDNKALYKANGIMLNSTLKSATSVENATAKKIRALMEKYGVLKELNDVAYKDTTDQLKAKRGIQNLSIYEFQKRGEYFVQGMTMVATMLHKQVTVSEKGVKKTIPLWEAYNENGEWKYDADVAWEGDVTNKEHLKEYFNFAHKITQINKSIHGNYDPNSPVRIKKGILGRATMQFRSWIAEGINQRYGGRRQDLLLGREREGRYITAYNLGVVNGVKALMRLSVGKDISDLVEDGTNVELVKENMKRNLMELYQKGFLLMLYLLLKSIEIDDDEWEKRLALNFTFNQVLRLQDDIEFFYNPQAAENITQNFIPAFALVRDVTKFYNAVEDGIVEGEWEYTTGKKSGENKILWTGAKVFPGGSATVSLLNKLENEESFRK